MVLLAGFKFLKCPKASKTSSLHSRAFTRSHHVTEICVVKVRDTEVSTQNAAAVVSFILHPASKMLLGFTIICHGHGSWRE